MIFFILKNLWNIEKFYGYNHTNFDSILEKFKFKKIFYGGSPYKKVLNSNTKSALFKNDSF